MTGPAGLLDLAVRAAGAGAAELMRRSGGPLAVEAKGPTDRVTDADRASGAAIARLLGAERPDDALVVEDVAEVAGRSTLRWVVDPLDGTVNYLYQLPRWVVSVACEAAGRDGWRAVAGVVVDPTGAETFTATTGGGAWLNGTPIAVNAAARLPTALIATEFSYSAAGRAAQGDTLAALMGRIRDVRCTGSSALDLCWTAAGRFDGFYEDELFRWDWSAGALIVSEAGGTVTPLGTGVLAAAPELHRQLGALVAGGSGGGRSG